MTLSVPPDTTQLIIHTDGGSRGNPGPAATGIVILNSEGKPLHSFGQSLGVATNNVAEYTAVIHALDWIVANSDPSSPPVLIFKLDSKLVVEQLSRHWKIKESHLAKLADNIWQTILIHHLSVSFTHIPRAQNFAADEQVNLTLDNL